jgi:hypothetical protein
LRESENSPQNGLSAADRREVERLEKAHRRKTALAVSIMRILNDLGSDAANATKLARVTELLTSTAHIDRESVSDAENMARTIIESPSYERMSDVGKPLRISEQQMMQYLSQIESYFIVEYTLILQSLSRLAARNVMRAGDLAENRLDDLRRAGFDGLGAVEQVTFDRVIWVILVTWFVTFAMFSLPSLYLGTMPKGFAPIILSIAGTFSLAALLGAIWGSRRSLAERRITPWSSYLAAGSLAIAGFFVIHTIRYLFDRDAAIARIVQAFPDRHITFVDYLFSQAPFALSPFIITVAICRLARIREWPTWPVLDLPARVKDGLTLGMLFLATSATSRFLHKLLGTAYAAGSANPDAVRFYLFQLAFFAIGFFIGLIVVGDVRNIAHSQIVASDYPRRPIPLVARTQPT